MSSKSHVHRLTIMAHSKDPAFPFSKCVTGEMQKSYVHGVPKEDCLGNDDDADRIAIVYRCGAYSEYTKDTGQCVSDLLPRPIVQRSFGQMDGMTEGESYGRTHIHEMGAHRYEQILSFNLNLFSQNTPFCLIKVTSRGREWQQGGRVRRNHCVGCSGGRVWRRFF
jgi:hypothetical protein